MRDAELQAEQLFVLPQRLETVHLTRRGRTDIEQFGLIYQNQVAVNVCVVCEDVDQDIDQRQNADLDQRARG